MWGDNTHCVRVKLPWSYVVGVRLSGSIFPRCIFSFQSGGAAAGVILSAASAHSHLLAVFSCDLYQLPMMIQMRTCQQNKYSVFAFTTLKPSHPPFEEIATFLHPVMF